LSVAGQGLAAIVSGVGVRLRCLRGGLELARESAVFVLLTLEHDQLAGESHLAIGGDRFGTLVDLPLALCPRFRVLQRLRFAVEDARLPELAPAVVDDLAPALDESEEPVAVLRSEEHTSELQSRENLVCR